MTARRLVAFAATCVVSVSMVVFAATADAQPPQPQVTAALSFNGSCTQATVTFTWSRWRADSVTVAVEDTSGISQASQTVDFNRTTRSGSAGVTTLNAPAAAPYNGSWAGQSVRGFAELWSPKGPGIIDRTEYQTCTPV